MLRTKKQQQAATILQQINAKLSQQPLAELATQLEQEYTPLCNQFNAQHLHIKEQITAVIPDWEYNLITIPEQHILITNSDINNSSLRNFCYAELNCLHDQKKWLVYQSLIQNCDWIFFYDQVCYICVSAAAR